ncbi:hypothetical protein U6Y50_12260, partial [Cutibacterium acnes]
SVSHIGKVGERQISSSEEAQFMRDVPQRNVSTTGNGEHRHPGIRPTAQWVCERGLLTAAARNRAPATSLRTTDQDSAS